MTAQKTYAQRAQEYEELAQKKKAQGSALPWWRGGLFLGTVVLVILIGTGDLGRAWSPLVLVSFVGFLVAVFVHRRLRREEEDARLMCEVNETALARVQGKWHEFSRLGERYRQDDHPYAQDLDLLGAGSLFQLLNTTTTRFGEDTLARWLLDHGSLEEIRERQRYVGDLKGRLALRQELQREGARIGTEAIGQDPELFLRWAESPVLFLPRTAWVWAVRLLPVWTTTCLLLYLLSMAPAALWLFPMLVQLVILGMAAKKAYPILLDVTSRQRAFSLYAALFERIDQEEAAGAPFEDFQKAFRARGLAPHASMKKLQFYIDLIDVRHTPLMHVPLNMLLLWDLQCLLRLEAWKEQLGTAVRGWFMQLGELEALCAFGSFGYDNPSYAFPTLLEEGEALRYEAKGLGHPLLESGQRVHNDITLGEGAAPMMLITGSNMSGKSTFLRAVGLNAALAYSGCVVCAESLELSWMQIGTSMRIKDSLEHGISYFMAELQRIRRILTLRECKEGLLFLLDEILHGTNTIERRQAALAIITQLSEAHTIGIITTHDQELADRCETFEEKMEYAYFTDEIKDGTMSFDYILREGLCPSSNALRLMELVGISLPDAYKPSTPS